VQRDARVPLDSSPQSVANHAIRSTKRHKSNARDSRPLTSRGPTERTLRTSHTETLTYAAPARCRSAAEVSFLYATAVGMWPKVNVITCSGSVVDELRCCNVVIAALSEVPTSLLRSGPPAPCARSGAVGHHGEMTAPNPRFVTPSPEGRRRAAPAAPRVCVQLGGTATELLTPALWRAPPVQDESGEGAFVWTRWHRQARDRLWRWIAVLGALSCRTLGNGARRAPPRPDRGPPQDGTLHARFH
jgi:hypothetical protein